MAYKHNYSFPPATESTPLTHVQIITYFRKMKFILCPASWKKTRLNRICLSMATSNCNHCEMDAQSTHNDCCQRHSFNCRPETAVWTKRMGIPSSHFSDRKNKTKEGRNLRAYTLMQIPNKNVLSNLNVYYINTKYYVALKVKGVQVVLLYIEMHIRNPEIYRRYRHICIHKSVAIYAQRGFLFRTGSSPVLE